ncbi:prepilin-type N-terminal cleavage/methylation domain-containing protein [Geoanaerobacter pelophilus]|nr:prepilin-type N-terminal cleavage/methylation domain-containing protein [Geoanaerobacter pelophilus]
MRSRGFSLIELLMIIGILSILYAIGTLSFNAYQKRYRAEAQTRFLFSEIQKARVDAICQRRWTRVKVYRDRFELYSSQQDNTSGVQPIQSYPLRLPVVWVPKDKYPYVIEFEPWGVLNADESSEGTICLEDSSGTGGVDSIKISSTRISIKKGDGDDCKSDITVK